LLHSLICEKRRPGFLQLIDFFWRESITFKMSKKYIGMAAIVNKF
jgi:hypothetical protein